MSKVETVEENCIGCGQCEEQCPVEGANVAYSDAEGNPKIKPNPEKCVSCGRCVAVCPNQARRYRAAEA